MFFFVCESNTGNKYMVLKNHVPRWLYTLQGKILLYVFIAISVMMLSIYMLYSYNIKLKQ